MGCPPTAATRCAPGCAASGPGSWWSRCPPTPELNPIEPLWASLKGVELANLAGDTLEDVIAAAERAIQRIRATPHLPFSFLRYCGLSLW
jgi:hypothetical protein